MGSPSTETRRHSCQAETPRGIEQFCPRTLRHRTVRDQRLMNLFSDARRCGPAAEDGRHLDRAMGMDWLRPRIDPKSATAYRSSLQDFARFHRVGSNRHRATGPAGEQQYPAVRLLAHSTDRDDRQGKLLFGSLSHIRRRNSSHVLRDSPIRPNSLRALLRRRRLDSLSHSDDGWRSRADMVRVVRATRPIFTRVASAAPRLASSSSAAIKTGIASTRR